MSEDESPVRVGADHERKYAGASKLATECVINLLRTESLVSAELSHRFRPYGLSVATFNVLVILEGAGEVEMMSALSEPEKDTLVLLLGKVQDHLHRRTESPQAGN